MNRKREKNRKTAGEYRKRFTWVEFPCQKLRERSTSNISLEFQNAVRQMSDENLENHLVNEGILYCFSLMLYQTGDEGDLTSRTVSLCKAGLSKKDNSSEDHQQCTSLCVLRFVCDLPLF